MVRIARRSLLRAAATSAVLLPGAALATTRGERPNFVVFYVDDLGYGDIEPTGGTTIRTPNLSRLARQGSVLTDYYAPATLCTPSRAGYLTGRYPIRTGLARGVIMQNEKRGLPLAETTIAEALRPAYATALIGKWHLGNPGTEAWPPSKHGFDLFYGIQYSHDMSPLSLWEDTGDRLEEMPVDYVQLQQQFANRAERFIEDHAEQPFFLTLALSQPHLPNYPPEPFAGQSRAGAYGDAVAEVDAIVGRIMDRLEALGLSRRTMVVFTSDNGPWFEGSPGPLRERKGGGAYDGASRVPLIVSQPGTIPHGRRCDSIAMGIDWLPTLCAMGGMSPPAGVELDGRDLTEVLLRSAASPHEELLLFNDEDVVGLRTQHWKYLDAVYYRNLMMPMRGRGYPQLYDTRMVGEDYSVASLHPDVVAAMQARLRAAQERFAPLRSGPSSVLDIPPSAHVPEMWRD
ncbi:sulfatase [Altererythrobacter sp. B11]|uniref:sulfatase-like hydrolase/transferase n=1 Tax=Altererythrobacter sp. B11 TaxID=2060312 RepID=UPI000DC6FD28|nr:sulfatase-like hydrolase/transferase [Altererythrobacter sp. B11]BBC74287.1 sulfatase [Altererythrobacter sp. B11]